MMINGIRQSDGKDTFIKIIPTISGLWVKYKKSVEPISPYIMNHKKMRFTNSIVMGGKVITMVEHIFSAVNGLGIDNVIIEFGSDEAPFFANSDSFAKVLIKNMVDIESKNREYLSIDKNIEIKGNNGQYCKVTPSDDFYVDITIDFEGIIGKQFFSYSFKTTDYLREIAYARSILMFKIKDMEKPWVDFNKHFDLFPHTLSDNPKLSPYIAYSENEFITPLKDPLEPVRHKLLDFIGDLVFLGKIPKARFEIHKPGHAFNRKIVEMIFNLKSSYNLQFDYFLKKIPEINILKNYTENNVVHNNEDVLSHTKKVFKNVIEILNRKDVNIENEKKFRFILAIFLHDYGKKDTFITEEGKTTSCKDHENVSVDNIIKENFLSRFDIIDYNKKWILYFIKNHAEIHKVFTEDDPETNININNFKLEHSGDFVENLIFGIADLKDSYFKISNQKEYERRIKILEGELKNVFNFKNLIK